MKQKQWWVWDWPLTSEGWQQNRDIIAARLARNDWAAVFGAVEALRALQHARKKYIKIQLAKMATDREMAPVLESATRLGLDIMDPTDDPIPEATVTAIESMLRSLQAGRVALAPLIEDARGADRDSSPEPR